jgi:hypothetical protein
MAQSHCVNDVGKPEAEYSRGSFLGGLGATAFVCSLTFGILYHWGHRWSISSSGWWALGGATAALIIKMFISDYGAKKFEWHKHGYDMCIMTLGTSLTALAYAFASDEFGREQLRYLGVVFVLAMIATFFTAGNSREIEVGAKDNPPKKCVSLKLANIVFGIFAIMMNLYVLVVKDVGTPRHQTPVLHAGPTVNGAQ